MYKICHVTSGHQPEDGRIFRRACVSSAMAGYETYLVERGDSYDKDGVHIVGLGQPEKSGRLYRMTKFAKKAFKVALKLDADIYHLHDTELLPYVTKFRKAGKKVVFDSHENYVELIQTKTYLPFPKLIANIFRLYSDKVYSKLDGFIYGGGAYPERYNKICKRITSIDNYPWKWEIYDKYDPDIIQEKRSACFFGTLGRDRGIEEIIKACYKANCKLYLAGHIFSGDYQAVLEQMKEYSCVEFLGVISHEQIIELMKRIEIGLCVLHNVGQYNTMTNLSTKVYEYMSMGMPVILNNTSYNQETVERLQFGICVDPMDIDEIANSIESLLDNDSLRKEMGLKGRKAVLESFCWDKEQNKLLDMYRDILDGKTEKNHK